jgi:histone deacetylase 1/2
MPESFWVEALNNAAHLLNIRPSRAIGNQTPHFLLYSLHPTYDHLRVFGCLCYPNLYATTPHKLAPRSVRCVLLGPPLEHKGYRCLDLSSRRVFTSRQVQFDETIFPFFQPPTADPAPSNPTTEDPVCHTLPNGISLGSRAPPDPTPHLPRTRQNILRDRRTPTRPGPPRAPTSPPLQSRHVALPRPLVPPLPHQQPLLARHLSPRPHQPHHLARFRCVHPRTCTP